MTLWVDRGYDRHMEGYVVRDLKKICPDPNMTFDLGSGVDQRFGSGEVSYPAVTVDTQWCRLIRDMVKSKSAIVIKARPSGFKIQVKGERVSLRDYTAFTHWDGLPSVNPIPTSITVMYDPTDDLNRGYWVENAAGKKIAAPPDVNLVHEFGHVEQALSGTLDPNDRETYPIARENTYRSDRKLPLRHGYEGGTNLRREGGSSGGDCFIATAAYGSMLDPDVEELRRFRDDILRQTRVGVRFFDEYWSHYYRLSPEIVRMMESSAELRELVRWSLVGPIVGYLRLGIAFPDEPAEDLPEPWRSYLLEMRDGFESWAENVGTPDSYSGIPPAAAAEELRIVLRYLLRTPRSRRAYLEELTDRGELPLAGTADDRAAVARTLRSDARTDDEIALVVGEPAGGSA